MEKKKRNIPPPPDFPMIVETLKIKLKVAFTFHDPLQTPLELGDPLHLIHDNQQEEKMSENKVVFIDIIDLLSLFFFGLSQVHTEKENPSALPLSLQKTHGS